MKINNAVLLALALLPFAATTTIAQEAQEKTTAAEPQTQTAAPAKAEKAEKAAPIAAKPETKEAADSQAPAESKATEKETPKADEGKAKEQTPPAPKPEDPATAAKKAAQREIQLMQMEKSKLEAQMSLAQTKLREKLAPQADARARLEVANALRNAKISAEFADNDETKRMIEAELALNSARDNQAMLERSTKIRIAELDSRIARAKQELEMNRYNLELTRARLQESDRAIAPEAQSYMKNPVKDGTLYISDRRIEFNGPVTERLAEFVVDRIHFFNNKSTEYPIFIVIDNSPGGSAFAGYQILKAMESSKAPVCVVLKSFCASMAAIVTTLAQESYCYDSSIILHHQASAATRGNIREMEEQLKDTKYWCGRLFEPVCKKIGVSQEDFVKDMYAHVSTGDWSVFGTEAVQRKWINNRVDKMVETGVVRNGSNGLGYSGFVYQHEDLVQKTDDRGNTYFELPSLKPGDAWLIFDPENRYRAR